MLPIPIQLAEGSYTCQKVAWIVLKEGNNFISCHIIFFLGFFYSVFFCHAIFTKKNKKFNNPDEKKYVGTSTQKRFALILFERFITCSRLIP